MVTDEQLLDEVRAVLHEEVADVGAPAALLPKLHTRLRRRRARRWLVAVPVVAAAAAAVVVVMPAPSTPEPAPQVDLAHATERTMSALDAVLDNVIYERATVTKGDKYSEPGQAALYERWLAADGSTFRMRVTIEGQPVVDLSRDRVSDVFVDYETRTYRVFPGTEPNAPRHDNVWTPAEIRQALADGELKVVGPGEPVGGRPTIRLADHTDVALTLWIDAETYLPVRWQADQPDSTPFDVTYLPPTPENTANLTTTIPEGFTEAK